VRVPGLLAEVDRAAVAVVCEHGHGGRGGDGPEPGRVQPAAFGDHGMAEQLTHRAVRVHEPEHTQHDQGEHLDRQEDAGHPGVHLDVQDGRRGGEQADRGGDHRAGQPGEHHLQVGADTERDDRQDEQLGDQDQHHHHEPGQTPRVRPTIAYSPPVSGNAEDSSA